MNRAGTSLRRRLLVWLLFSTAFFGALALLDTYNEALKTADVVSDRVLSGSALAIAERVVVSEDGTLEVDIPYVALEMLTSAAQDRVFYRVDGADGVFLTGYQQLPVPEIMLSEVPVYVNADFRGETIRVAAIQRFASTGINSVPFTVTVAETTMARNQLAQAILLRSALRLLLMIVGAAVIVWVAVTLSLRPLYRLSEAIGQRSPNDLAPIQQSVPTEVENLVVAVNSLMVRLNSTMNALRNFTGNASHQLRTPLAIIRTQLALTSRAATLEDAKTLARKGDTSVAHAEHVLAQLLRMANIDAASSQSYNLLQTVELTNFAQNIAAEYVPRASEAKIDLGFESDGEFVVHAEPLLLGEMLGNLLSNAINYAGAGAIVTVRTLSLDGVICLEVEDNGPGVRPENRSHIRERFARGNVQPVSGAGLGLSIVEEIAGLFNAKLELMDGAQGKGLLARVVFPSK